MREITTTEKNGNGQQKIGQREHLANFPVAVFQLPPFPLPFLPFTSCTDTLTLPSDEQQQGRI